MASWTVLSVVECSTPVPSYELQESESALQVEESPPPKGGFVESATTVFSIWNTMIGASLLTFPWGFTNAGLAGGVAVILCMGAVTWYTTFLVMRSGGEHSDFIDVCAEHLGRLGRWVAWLGSVLVLFAIMTILITSTIYSFIGGLWEVSKHEKMPYSLQWNVKSAKAIIAAVLVLPLVSLPPFRWAVRVSSSGVICMLLILASIVVSSGLNWDSDASKSWAVEKKFYYLAGIACLCFFPHNFVLQVTKGKDRRRALRDVTIGFWGGVSTVLITGAFAYSSLGSKLPQNFFDYFSSTYPLAMCSRAVLSLQIASIMPLAFGVLRIQIVGAVVGTSRAEMLAVYWRLAYGVVVLSLMTLIAVFYPRVGDVMRFVGSFSGFLYVFMLPVSVHLVIKYRAGELRPTRVVLHCLLLVLGALIIVSQFI
eukprot:m51a1_g8142 hypothetical protein (424) ;mRNA; f:28375-30128